MREGTPLRRTSDRVEAAGRRICLVVAALSIAIGPVVGWSTYQSGSAAADRYADDLLRVEAVTVESATGRHFWPGDPTVPVEVTWTGPGDVAHRGEALVPVGTTAGSEIEIWTTERAEITDAPPTRAQLVADAVLAAARIMLGLGGGAFAAFLALRYGRNRLRYRSWDRAWENYCARHSLS